MAGVMSGIVDQVERQKTAIETALRALRGIEGVEAPAPASANSAPVKQGRNDSGRSPTSIGGTEETVGGEERAPREPAEACTS
jgi:hypothetical protein